VTGTRSSKLSLGEQLAAISKPSMAVVAVVLNQSPRRITQLGVVPVGSLAGQAVDVAQRQRLRRACVPKKFDDLPVLLGEGVGRHVVSPIEASSRCAV
jgi:hypothetical protein